MENLMIVQLSVAELRSIFREEVKNELEKWNLKNGNTEDKDEFLSFKEACKLLKTPVSTLYYYTSKSIVPHVKRGKKLFFIKGDLVQWIKDGKKKPLQDEKKEDVFLLKLRKKGKIK